MTTRPELLDKFRAARDTLECLDELHRNSWSHTTTIRKITCDLDFFIETAKLRSDNELQCIWKVLSDILDSQDIQILTPCMKARIAA